MLINSQKPAMEVIGQACLPADAVKLAASEDPDLILLDMDLGVISSIEILPDLLTRCDARILVLTGLRDAELHQRAIKAGARGVLLKSESAKVILKAIRKVCDGELWIDNSLMTGLLSGLNKNQNMSQTDDQRRIGELTAREREIIKTLVNYEGSTNSEIARHLFTSESTLKNHLTSIYSKLGIKNRIQLLKYALAHNLAGPPH